MSLYDEVQAEKENLEQSLEDISGRLRETEEQLTEEKEMLAQTKASLENIVSQFYVKVHLVFPMKPLHQRNPLLRLLGFLKCSGLFIYKVSCVISLERISLKSNFPKRRVGFFSRGLSIPLCFIRQGFRNHRQY